MMADIEEHARAGSLARIIWPVDVAALDLDVLVLARDRTGDFAHGRAWPAPTAPLPSQWERLGEGTSHSDLPQSTGGQTATGTIGTLLRAYDEDGRFLGLVESLDGCWQPRLAIPDETSLTGPEP